MAITPHLSRVVRHKEFSRRLETACVAHPHAPSGHGRQKWVADKIYETFGLKVSTQAIHKWFSGEARPRPSAMSRLAQVLEVDEAWLSLGIIPDDRPIEKKSRSAVASGAVNLVAGLIQMNGGHIAFPDESDDTHAVDIFGIIGAKPHSIEVKLARTVHPDNVLFTVSPGYAGRLVIGVIPSFEPTRFDLVRLPTHLIDRHGKGKGGFVELEIERRGAQLVSGADHWPLIKSFDNLDGEVPSAPKKAPVRRAAAA